MQQTTPERHGALIFWLVFLSIAGGIAATALLANEGRNLARVTRAIGVETRAFSAPASIAAVKGRRIGGNAAIIPAHMLLPPVAKSDSAFYRTFEHVEGAALCEAFRKAGFEMSAWEGNAFSRSILECSYNLSIDKRADAANASNFFLLVRGHASGGIISVRAKIVVNDENARKQLGKHAADMLKVLARQTQWPDLADAVPRAANLDGFDIEARGMSLRLQGELSAPGRFNLVIMPISKLTPAERRTKEYFKRPGFLPFAPPQHSVSREMEWMNSERRSQLDADDPA